MKKFLLYGNIRIESDKVLKIWVLNVFQFKQNNFITKASSEQSFCFFRICVGVASSCYNQAAFKLILSFSAISAYFNADQLEEPCEHYQDLQFLWTRAQWFLWAYVFFETPWLFRKTTYYFINLKDFFMLFVKKHLQSIVIYMHQKVITN